MSFSGRIEHKGVLCVPVVAVLCSVLVQSAFFQDPGQGPEPRESFGEDLGDYPGDASEECAARSGLHPGAARSE